MSALTYTDLSAFVLLGVVVQQEGVKEGLEVKKTETEKSEAVSESSSAGMAPGTPAATAGHPLAPASEKVRASITMATPAFVTNVRMIFTGPTHCSVSMLCSI